MMEKTANQKGNNVLARLFSRNEVGTLLPLLLLCVVVGSVNKDFFAVGNLADMLRTTSFSFLIAAPLTCLMITGGIDMTIGAVTSLGGVVCASAMVNYGMPIWVAILVAMVAGAIVGIIKALIVVKAKLPGFIITLGLMYVVNGAILIYTQGLPITGFDKVFKVLGQGRVFGIIYWTIIVSILVGVAFQILLSTTKFGRSLHAVGGNEETAKLAGINVDRTRFVMNIVVSVFAALCGVFMASRFNSAQPSIGSGSELTIMAAVIIGGTSMLGGTGTVTGTFLGCLLMAIINNGLIMMHVTSFWTSFIFGTILIISLFIDKYRHSKNAVS